MGQAYYGPVVLITDARCYSATDIFAAGFQDHEIGPVVGVATYTGAGGANVWTHVLLRQLLPAGSSPLQPLPAQAGFRVAVRRTTRVGKHAGELLEDLGVRADVPHAVTEADLLHDNRDLVEAAVQAIDGRLTRSLAVRLTNAADSTHVEVIALNLDRVDAYVNGRPIGSEDVAFGRCSFVIARDDAPGPRELRLEGFDKGHLRAAKLVSVPAA